MIKRIIDASKQRDDAQDRLVWMVLCVLILLAIITFTLVLASGLAEFRG